MWLKELTNGIICEKVALPRNLLLTGPNKRKMSGSSAVQFSCGVDSQYTKSLLLESSQEPERLFRWINCSDCSNAEVCIDEYESVDFELVNSAKISTCWYAIRKGLIRKHELARLLTKFITKEEARIAESLSAGSSSLPALASAEFCRPRFDAFDEIYPRASFSNGLCDYKLPSPVLYSGLRNAVPPSFLLQVDDVDSMDEAFFDLPAEVRDELESADDCDDTSESWPRWILKVPYLEGARGIHFVRSQSDICRVVSEVHAENHLLRDFVLQRHIERPLLLLNRRKFHLRIYVLCVGDLTVYLWTRVLCLFSGNEFTSDDSLTAITNTCAQRDRPDFDESKVIFELGELENKEDGTMKQLLQLQDASCPDVEADDSEENADSDEEEINRRYAAFAPKRFPNRLRRQRLLSPTADEAEQISCESTIRPVSELPKDGRLVLLHQAQCIIHDLFSHMHNERSRFQPQPFSWEIFGLDFVADDVS